MAADGDGVLSEGRMRGLLDLFERLRERPTLRQRDRLRPLLLLLGPGNRTRAVADAFKKRCEDEWAPVSHFAADTVTTDTASVLREAKRELSKRSSSPRWEPSMRFPLLEMALWLRDLREIRIQGDPVLPANASAAERENHRLVYDLTHSPVCDSEEARRQALRRVIRKRGRDVLRDLEDTRRGRGATFMGFLEQIVPIGVAVVALVSAGAAAAIDLLAAGLAAAFGLAFVATQFLIRTRGKFADVRFAWFRRQPYLNSGSTDFLSFALGVFDPRPLEPGDQAEQLDLLLVAAFLEDLRRNYRRDYRRAAWARVRYPVLIFEHLTPGHPGVAFLETVERVRARMQSEPGRHRIDPLVIVAGVDPTAPSDPDPLVPSGQRLLDRVTRAMRADPLSGEPADVVAAGRLWSHYRRDQRFAEALGSRRDLRVDVTRDPGGDLPPVTPPRGRPWLTHPVLPWVAMVAVTVASVALIVVPTLGYCSPDQIRRTGDGECVGITDGAFHFGESSAGENNDNRLSPVLRRIKKQNDEVKKSGKVHVTVVYLGPVTADPQIKNHQIDLLAGAQGELMGLAIAQQRFNDATQNLRLRILVANAGAKFRYAEQVAEQIRERALEDRSIVAVVGFEQSKVQTQQAIKVLTKSALPMVGTANSYGRTAMLDRGGFSPYYFRLAPPNSRLARHAAFWARNGEVGGRKARTAEVIYSADPDDLYSQDLAHEFRKAFGAGNVRMWPYQDPGEVTQAAEKACRDPKDLFYYGGRSDEFRTFVNALDHACGGRPVVLADDEIAKYVTDNAAEIGRKGTYELYFTPLAAREAWTGRWIGKDQAPQTFYSDYDRVVQESGQNELPGQRPSVTRAAVSYDAATMIAKLADAIYYQQKAEPTPGAVFAALNDPERDVLPRGASGVIRFGPRSTGHQVPDKPVMLATVRPDGRIEVSQVCGRLVPSGQGKARCP
ncbi:hypothetical protein [Spirillospora sp. CA-294931]|uniref:hypothetical protein n=1 Tax=Spirillospora sp. CA-294931 TaxID=3240042 RepID=UPI003D8CCDA7